MTIIVMVFYRLNTHTFHDFALLATLRQRVGLPATLLQSERVQY